MTPQHWSRIKGIFSEALEKPKPERPAFLDSACGGDAALRAEVERLLAESDAASLPSPARGFLDTARDPAPGDTMAHYCIQARLGEGGMGVVYKAKDTRLGRSIALKFIKAQFGRQWEREARAVAALNHPHIATLYEAGDLEGRPYLAMEFVDGRPLEGPLPVEQAIGYGIQVAEALAAAHAAGVVHRDLKPANILVTENGDVKVLDFGLAKLAEQEAGAVSTQTVGLAGTPGYLAPEQIEGKPGDARSDIFAFGCILYELLSGRRAFPGETIAAALTATAIKEPKRLDGVPERLDELVRLCLRKDPARRFQHMDDVKVELEKLKQPGAAAAHVHASRKLWLAIPVLLAAALAAGGIYYRSHQTKPLTNKGVLVLADFTNRTGDPVFDGALRQGLSAQLEQSPNLSLLSDRRIGQTLTLLAQPKDAFLTPALSRDICQRTGGAAVLDASISQTGTRYLLTLQATGCADGESLAGAEAQAADKNHVLDALGKIASQMRAKLGESLASVRQYDVPPQDVTTPSLEALKAYSVGNRLMVVKNDNAAAIPVFQQAISLDPQFAAAYASLGICYYNLSEPSRAADNLQKAYELRGRLSEREKLSIAASREAMVTGNLEAARKAYDLWARIYPRDPIAIVNLGVVNDILGHDQDALAAFQESWKLNPANALVLSNIVSLYVKLNRLEEAQASAREAQARHLDNPQLHEVLYQVDFLKHDPAGMEREAAELIHKPGWEDLIVAFESDTAAYTGQFAKARELTRRAAGAAQRTDKKETGAAYIAEAAVREALVGNLSLAKRQALEALALSSNKEAQAMSAIALALAGDAAEATRLAGVLDKQFPEDTIVQFRSLPSIRGALALRGGDSGKAIQVLAASAPYELGDLAQNVSSSLYPVYLRGEAYLAARQGLAASAEFQRVLDYPGIVQNQVIGPLANLGLARAYVLAGDLDRAKSAYQTFLELWKDADADLPILQQAKAEWAKFQ
jgi:eukaryotic-like serine/threonine-protein kinase